LFPVHNVGEPGVLEGEDRRLEDLTPQELDALFENMWIRDLTDYGFPGESIEGRMHNGKLKFCGGLGSCDDKSPGCIYNGIIGIPRELKEKLR